MTLIGMKRLVISSELEYETICNVVESIRAMMWSLKRQAQLLEMGCLDQKDKFQHNFEPIPAPVTSNLGGLMDALHRILWAFCAGVSIVLFRRALGCGYWHWCIAAIWMCFYGMYTAVGGTLNIACQFRVRVLLLGIGWSAGLGRGTEFIRQYPWNGQGDISNPYLDQVRREIASLSQMRDPATPGKADQVLRVFRLCIWLLCSCFMIDMFRANGTSVNWHAGPVNFVWLLLQCLKGMYDELDVVRLLWRR
ncbi:hypothetical protein IFR05_004170 [Cadophora sp. M221]|nr:hypothetical protein IFR05_004170 [Cadophora sp. M221]